eukprot:TRINITY_DN3706_c0_g1_i1.p1 TRINITY_DN3706_c0_g1~~TRINITY_DN3706_c0_g1_i1.p1  ORF type:complete len:268 (-),score=64.05 TRINITY_DN3706_c0_g1_i1:120-923(-)
MTASLIVSAAAQNPAPIISGITHHIYLFIFHHSILTALTPSSTLPHRSPPPESSSPSPSIIHIIIMYSAARSNNDEAVQQLFVVLDYIMRPNLAKYAATFSKAYQVRVERFLQTATLEFGAEVNWALIFNQKMEITRKLTTAERYTQYLDAMMYYTEIIDRQLNPPPPQPTVTSHSPFSLGRKTKHVQSPPPPQPPVKKDADITKNQKFLFRLANAFVKFLQTYEMDTDSSLIGLPPSDNVIDSCSEYERSLPHFLSLLRQEDTSTI